MLVVVARSFVCDGWCVVVGGGVMCVWMCMNDDCDGYGE